MRKKSNGSKLDKIIREQMNSPVFAEAWSETELEDQVKRMLIQVRI